ncbi:MAG TPA: transglycosylase SLT domain-containing protein [Allosphingosinicella sp.]|jgi:hypothetical protein
MTSSTAVSEAAPQGRVDAAIRQAAARSGVDFGYLYNQARVESGLNPNAKARTSSATGLFQFLDQTWLATIDKHGAANGLGWAANAVQRGANGRYFVGDPQLKQQVMNLRRDPAAASAMAAEFAKDNQAHLQSRLGRPLQSVDLYMAHFLGAGGATRFLKAHDARPGASAAASFPEQARANRSIFFKRDGNPRSFAEVRNMMAAKLSIGGRSVGMQASAVRTAPAAQPAPPPLDLAALETGSTMQPTVALAPRYARLAYLMLAELGA